MWFVIKAGYSQPKAIPMDIKFKGCPKRISNKCYEGSHEDIVNHLIETFEGEFI